MSAERDAIQLRTGVRQLGSDPAPAFRKPASRASATSVLKRLSRIFRLNVCSNPGWKRLRSARLAGACGDPS